MAKSFLASKQAAMGSSTSKNQTRDELEAALDTGGDANKRAYSFPSDLKILDHWLAIRIANHELLRKSDFAVDETLEYIFLPMPGNLSTSYQQNWTQTELGLAGALGAEFGQDMKNKGGVAAGLKHGINNRIASAKDAFKSSGGAWDSIQSAVSPGSGLWDFGQYYAEASISEVGGAIGAVAGDKIPGVGAATGAVIGTIASQYMKGAVAGAGVARNPFMAMLYSAPQFRPYQFQWKFIPRSVEEVNTLREVIYRLKYASAPNLNSHNPHYFDYPNLFDIDFHYPEYLFNMGPSICKSIEVEYHAENQPMYFDIPKEIDKRQDFTKAPVSITLTMSLEEMFVVTKEQLSTENR